jgi:hypothetical protein
MRSLAVSFVLICAATAPLAAQHQECAETTIPKTLPAPHDIIDSTGAIDELRAFDKLARDMQFSLVYTDDDSTPAVSPLEGADIQASFVLVRSLWPQKPTGTWAVRVHIRQDSTTGAATLTLQRSIYCPPVPEPRPPLARRIGALVQPGDHRPPPGVQRITVKFESWIDEEGNVISVHVTQSSGFADMDNQLAQDWLRRRFKPALIDGRPIKALYRTDRGSPKL